MNVQDVLADLVAEQESLDDAIADFTEEQWQLDSPSERWSIADQIAHLAYFDATAALAIENAASFKASARQLFDCMGDDLALDQLTLGECRQMDGAGLLERWRSNRLQLASTATELADEDRVPWYGPSMGSKSFLTARLMEAWAHGQYVLETVGRTVQPTDRLAHIARLGFITRGWAYANRGIEVPDTEVHVSLTAPSGAIWNYGNPDAPESISGSALDFCRVTAQIRHVADTDLVATGAAAIDWMEKAQIFAGPPTDGPAAT